ncbi:MAG: twin transmembrane helix small protein [Alphaproteobacteria bacterium]|nr:twin transmembrane helix small protein [Alphaproteobacteria bacterium]
MSDTLTILLFVAMGITLVVLFTGLISMARGGEFDRKNSNRLMRLRVLFQVIAILIFILLAFVFKGD